MKRLKIRGAVISFIFLCLFWVCGQSSSLEAQVTGSYHIIDKVTVNNTNVSGLSKLVIIFPLAQSNQYQTVSNVITHGGEVLDVPETDDKYLRWIITSEGGNGQTYLPSPGQQEDIYYEFDISLNTFTFDFNQITTIYPYNTNSDTYRWHAGTSGPYVDPNNSTIQAIGSSIWDQSSDLVDYARKCYEYVAQNYKYLNPGTGLHPLSEILESGGGDCGNLTSIYVSLLRYKNIPSRHIVTIKPDGSGHAWADFYLENYGWIPVDVTHKNRNPSGDYFGIYDGNGIVFTKGVYLLLDRGDTTYWCPLLQTYSWWRWYLPGGTNISSSYALMSSCICPISPPSYAFNASSNTGTITVTPCSDTISWTAASNNDWIDITSGSNGGTVIGTVSYTVGANTTGIARKGTITIGGRTFTIRQAAAIFYDDPNDLFTPHIYAITTEGITRGCWGNSNYFCPYDVVTRGAMAAFIIRAIYGEDFSYTQTPYFYDVPAEHGFFKYVQMMRDTGITKVVGTYMVDDVVTRGAMAAFIIRAKYGEDFTYTQTPYFTDVPESNGYFKYVQKMKDDGITGNVGTYNWTDVVIREHMAAFLARAFLGMQ